MGKKGQALTEFILVLPVILIILMAVFNVGYIYLEKYNLEKELETVSTLYENNETKSLMAYTSKEDITFDEKRTGNLVELVVSKNIKVSAPVLNKVLGENMKIETAKTIYLGEENE